jgi:hypothetical protein
MATIGSVSINQADVGRVTVFQPNQTTVVSPKYSPKPNVALAPVVLAAGRAPCASSSNPEVASFVLRARAVVVGLDCVEFLVDVSSDDTIGIMC